MLLIFSTNLFKLPARKPIMINIQGQREYIAKVMYLEKIKHLIIQNVGNTAYLERREQYCILYVRHQALSKLHVHNMDCPHTDSVSLLVFSIYISLDVQFFSCTNIYEIIMTTLAHGDPKTQKISIYLILLYKIINLVILQHIG